MPLAHPALMAVEPRVVVNCVRVPCQPTEDHLANMIPHWIGEGADFGHIVWCHLDDLLDPLNDVFIHECTFNGLLLLTCLQCVLLDDSDFLIEDDVFHRIISGALRDSIGYGHS